MIPFSIARKATIGHEEGAPAIQATVSVSLHYILSFSNDTYGHATSLTNIKKKITSSKNQPPYKESVPEDYYVKSNATTPPARKANAAFVLLGALVLPDAWSMLISACSARNTDLNGVVSSMKQMEDRFNKKFQYPYVFLNDQPFDEAFKKCGSPYFPEHKF
ncbi:hypothetical protein H0H87_000008 [Tephrocybe sp. NHM501043]|nr:hypothetical protein H0H87_000008 [Tephrocybe sp. NHM501043]